MALGERDFDKAESRMAELRGDVRVVAACYDGAARRIVVSLDSGLDLTFPPELAQGLAGAAAADLAEIEIGPAGLGLHWPRLDADLYVPALLGGAFGSRRWMAARLGAAGGRVRSAAKAASSRENGRKGGRPRKSAAKG